MEQRLQRQTLVALEVLLPEPSVDWLGAQHYMFMSVVKVVLTEPQDSMVVALVVTIRAAPCGVVAVAVRQTFAQQSVTLILALL
mgnify:CR=1 FL=1